MTHAYSESYLNNAKDRLSSFFDYAINDCKLKPDWITALFINTGYAEQFERGNPAYVAGMSGVELARAVITKAYGPKELPAPTNAEDCSPEYWAGWAVAEYQWFTGRRFKDIFERIPLSKIIRMYSVYHEMDITSFIDTMEGLYKAAEGDSNLKRIRENRGLSQAELAEQSGVNLRNIQMYEQRVNGIDKAQANILYKFARVLGCNVEESVMQRMDIERLRTALKMLAPEERAIIQDFFFTESPIPVKELVEKYPMPKTSIYRKWDDALKTLKKILGNA